MERVPDWTDVDPFPARLAAARRLLETLATRGHEIAASTNVSYLDQLQAAMSDAHRVWRDTTVLLPIIEPARWTGVRPVDVPYGSEAHVHLVAAAMGCLPCHHMRRGGSPGIVTINLNLRLALCPRCVRTHRKPIAGPRCEVCDENVADNVFFPLYVHVGSAIFVGDAGVSCCGHLATEATA